MTYQGMAGTPTSAPESESATESGLQPGEVVLGHFVGLSAEGKPLVEFNENPQPDALIAVSTVNLTRQQIGRQVALLFAEGDLSKPVILGLLHSYQGGDEPATDADGKPFCQRGKCATNSRPGGWRGRADRRQKGNCAALWGSQHYSDQGG